MIVDTDILIEMMRTELDHRVERWMCSQDLQPATTAIAISEILSGISLVQDRYQRALFESIVRRVREQDFAYQILPFDEEAAENYGRLMEQHGADNDFHVADLQTAAIALSHRQVLVTRNTGVFERLGVEAFDPLAPG